MIRDGIDYDTWVPYSECPACGVVIVQKRVRGATARDVECGCHLRVVFGSDPCIDAFLQSLSDELQKKRDAVMLEIGRRNCACEGPVDE